jgi:hypothetical protein
MYICGIGPVCIIGVALNILNAKTFRRMNIEKLIGIYLLSCLAYCDMALLSISFILFPLRHIVARLHKGNDVLNAIYGEFEILPYMYYSAEIPYFISLEVRNHMMVLVALER